MDLSNILLVAAILVLPVGFVLYLILAPRRSRAQQAARLARFSEVAEQLGLTYGGGRITGEYEGFSISIHPEQDTVDPIRFQVEEGVQCALSMEAGEHSADGQPEPPLRVVQFSDPALNRFFQQRWASHQAERRLMSIQELAALARHADLIEWVRIDHGGVRCRPKVAPVATKLGPRGSQRAEDFEVLFPLLAKIARQIERGPLYRLWDDKVDPNPVAARMQTHGHRAEPLEHQQPAEARLKDVDVGWYVGVTDKLYRIVARRICEERRAEDHVIVSHELLLEQVSAGADKRALLAWRYEYDDAQEGEHMHVFIDHFSSLAALNKTQADLDHFVDQDDGRLIHDGTTYDFAAKLGPITRRERRMPVGKPGDVAEELCERYLFETNLTGEIGIEIWRTVNPTETHEVRYGLPLTE
ncbi:MAG: hypothetical protein ABI333_03240 [bacterium]